MPHRWLLLSLFLYTQASSKDNTQQVAFRRRRPQGYPKFFYVPTTRKSLTGLNCFFILIFFKKNYFLFVDRQFQDYWFSLHFFSVHFVANWELDTLEPSTYDPKTVKAGPDYGGISKQYGVNSSWSVGKLPQTFVQPRAVFYSEWHTLKPHPQTSNNCVLARGKTSWTRWAWTSRG